MKKKICGVMIFNVLICNLVFASNVDTLKKNIQKIESEIKQKNLRIQSIDTEKTNLEKEIAINAKEIEEIKKERDRIQEEIRVVLRKMSNNRKKFSLTEAELERIKKENNIKIKNWNRYSLEKENNEVSQENVFYFKKILNKDTTRIKQVETVKVDILESQKIAEKERLDLQRLQNKALENRKKMDKIIVQQEILVKRLNVEKQTHQSRIKKLAVDKSKIQKQIQKIISARTKVNKNVNLKTAKRNLGKLSRPIKGNVVTKFNQRKNGVPSNGLEIRNELGATVSAAAAGKVIYSDEFQGLGKVVMIDYGSNLIGVYGNLISANAKMNKLVKKGENIGVLGLSTDGKAELYYEVRFKLKAVNPEDFF
ncbi:MAG: murein hydrolase activator EnvC family protein [Fusobacteriaceae bacterium]